MVATQIEFVFEEREIVPGKRMFKRVFWSFGPCINGFAYCKLIVRVDGHPSRYGHWLNENVTLYNDCVHWCLPGPIDTWSDFLLGMLKMEGVSSAEERLHLHSN